jgi:hypothetical protein
MRLRGPLKIKWRLQIRTYPNDTSWCSSASSFECYQEQDSSAYDAVALSPAPWQWNYCMPKRKCRPPGQDIEAVSKSLPPQQAVRER